MAPRKSVWQSFLQCDSSTAWIAVVVASLSLFYYFSKTRGGRRRGNGAGGVGGGGGSATAASGTSASAAAARGDESLRQVLSSGRYSGWSVAIASECFVADDNTLLPGAEAALRTLLEKTELYVFCRVESADAARLKRVALLSLLRSLGGAFVDSRLLMCTTEKGYEAFARQLRPSLTILNDAKLATFLAQFLPYLVVVSAGGGKLAKSNVEVVSALKDLHLA